MVVRKPKHEEPVCEVSFSRRQAYYALLCGTLALLCVVGFWTDYKRIRTVREAGRTSSLARAEDDVGVDANALHDTRRSYFNNLTAAEQHSVTLARHAEALWVQDRGYMWMQHSRKAGGTSLCMLLRQNSEGLIRVQHRLNNEPRVTCQLVKLCGSDCNVKKKFSTNELFGKVSHAMEVAGRNLIEVEGSGVPNDLLTTSTSTNSTEDAESVWKDFVFVSTIRHPLDRIESALRNDNLAWSCRKPHLNDTERLKCRSDFVDSNATILSRCSGKVYDCHSNYYVRTFSGMDTNYTTDAEMLRLAKERFLRFSCVVLQEAWDETIPCLATKLGLHLTRQAKLFNVEGQMKGAVSLAVAQNVKQVKQPRTVSAEAYTRLVELNRVDLEFYEWAKYQIMTLMN
jgi:hypothetical protein